MIQKKERRSAVFLFVIMQKKPSRKYTCRKRRQIRQVDKKHFPFAAERKRQPGGYFSKKSRTNQECGFCHMNYHVSRYKRSRLTDGGCFCVHICGGGREGDPHMYHPQQADKCRRLVIPEQMRCQCRGEMKTRFAPTPGLPTEVLNDMWVCSEHCVAGVYSIDIYQQCNDYILSRGGCGKPGVGFHMNGCTECTTVLQKILGEHALPASAAPCSPVASDLKLSSPVLLQPPSNSMYSTFFPAEKLQSSATTFQPLSIDAAFNRTNPHQSPEVICRPLRIALPPSSPPVPSSPSFNILDNMFQPYGTKRCVNCTCKLCIPPIDFNSFANSLDCDELDPLFKDLSDMI